LFEPSAQEMSIPMAFAPALLDLRKIINGVSGTQRCQRLHKSISKL
jgi:hypothetical protein